MSQFQKIWPKSDDDRIGEHFIFLYMMERKGFFEVLEYINKEHSVQYTQIEKYATYEGLTDDNKISIRIILNALSNMGLIDSNCETMPNTNYRLTAFGKKIVNGFYTNL